MAKKNHKRHSVSRLLVPVALAVTLAACSSKPSAPTAVDITLDPSQTAQSYLMLADSSSGSLQNDWLIMALKAAVQAGDTDQADLLLKRIAKLKLSPVQQAEWQLSRAELLERQQRYRDALQLLNFRTDWPLANIQWQDYYRLRARLLEQVGQYFEASRELTQLNMYAQGEDGQIADAIWQNLMQYNEQQINQLSAMPQEEVLDGWLQLAVYVKSLSGDVSLLKNSLENWMAENPTHPAAIFTPQAINDILALQISKPVNTALLLPLGGKYAKQAQLIRDGFILEMMNDEVRDPNATLTVIDVNGQDLASINQQLVNKNIDFVVGPLVKSNITKLQQISRDNGYTIPTLALNIPDQIETGDSTCYLALSPEQEVAQAAKHLYQQGYRYPLILAPQGRLGERVVEAFNEEWRQLSDNKVAVSLFGDKRQLQRNINNVFGLQESQQHIAQMEQILDIPLESQPRSRRDIDAVYIVADSGELTLIKPFIEVAINPDTKPPKLFSNSRSNSGRTQYEDLSGVMYSDIPLLIQPDDALEAQLTELWPKHSNAEKRLQALGMDAYQLMQQLPQMKVVDGYTIEGKTGQLSIDDQCIVQREISWAEHSAQ